MADTYKYYDLVTNTGAIVPDTSEVLSDIQTEFREVFGADLDITPETPQGRLIEVRTLERMDTIRLNALMANQINPDIATGNFLDAIAALTDCYRDQATQSRVEATVTGMAGTVIPAGALARTQAGDDFYAENTISIPLTGTATAVFLSVVGGAVAVPPGSLVNIIDGVVGWETITNDTPAVLGSDVLSDRDFRIKRRRTLFTGAAYLGAMESELWRVPNVQGVKVLDNNTSAPVTLDNVTMLPHSIYACVYGGLDADIGLALYKTKTVGAAYNGSVSVEIADPVNGETVTVSFERPTVIQIKAEITIESLSPVYNLTQAVLDALAAYEVGEITNVTGLNIGVDVSPFEMAAAIVSSISGVLVRNVRIAKLADALATANIEIHSNEIARIPAASVVINLV